MTDTALTEISRKCRAIVMFGPPVPHAGFKAGTYFQVTIDPEMMSPGGDYIRFGSVPGDEIHGWQRIDAMTVCEILGYYEDDGSYPAAAPGVDESQLRMMVVDNELQPSRVS